MDLKIKDVSDLLNVSETTIRRWLADGKIPAYRINQQFRFSRIEIENWVMNHKFGKANGFSPKEEEIDHNKMTSGGSKQFSLYRALHKGEVFYNVPGKNKEQIIRYTTKMLAKSMNLDPEVLADLLMDRENLQPTALNNGVGMPHTRDFLLSAHYDVVAITLPEKPIPYGAMDGLPVDIFFFIFACEDKRHLHLVAKIAHLSNQAEALQFLRTKPSKNQILEYVKDWESNIPVPKEDS